MCPPPVYITNVHLLPVTRTHHMYRSVNPQPDGAPFPPWTSFACAERGMSDSCCQDDNLLVLKSTESSMSMEN